MRVGLFFRLILVLGLLVAGCEPKPKSINYGGEECAYCKMMITDAEFGSQIVNHQGKAYKFDSVECMAAFTVTNDEENIHSKWVPNFHQPDEWLLAEDAVYLHSETLRSPMGLFMSAYADRASAEEMKEEYGGDIIDFNTVKEVVKNAWLSDDSDSKMMNH